MDLSSFSGKSEQVMTVIETIKNDPNFFNEFKENPQQALSKIGVELNEEELAMLSKLENLRDLEQGAEGIFEKIKGLFGFKSENS